MGGEIYYTYLGNNQYEITLKIYRDCILPAGASNLVYFDHPASVTIYDGGNLSSFYQDIDVEISGSDSLPVPVVINNPCLQAPPNICVYEGVYKQVVTLPPNSSGYYVAYQRCCRNGSILNLNLPGDQGSTYMCFIPPQNLASGNSSPRYNQFPPLALCVGENLVFDHSATDPDGDVLVYELCDAYEGLAPTNPIALGDPTPPPPYAFVTYTAGYTGTNPIAANPALQINSNTGLLTVTPNQVGQYVVAVCVKEYRNGQLLSTNKRDFQFNVVNCTSNVLAAIPGQTSECLGRNVTFSNNSINSTFYHWDFGISTWSTDTSNLEAPTFTYPDTGIYPITLIANPGWPCADTATIDYVINERLEADIIPFEPQCFDGNSFDFTASGIFQSYSTFIWNFGSNANTQSSVLENPENISFNTPDTFLVHLEIESDGCYSHDSTEIIIYDNPVAHFSPTPLVGCDPFRVDFRDSSTYGFALSHQWSFGDSATSNQLNPVHTYTNGGTYDVTLRVISHFGCKDTSYFNIPGLITVLPKPSALLVADTLFRSEFNPTFTLTDRSSGSIDCRLEFSNGFRFDTCNLQQTFEGDTGIISIKQIVVNDLGCPDYYHLQLYIQPEYVVYIPNSFTPNGDGRNDLFYPEGMGFKQYKLEIFNRWGEEIFRSINYNEGWDGTYRGQDLSKCSSDVYAYKLYIRGVDLETHIFSGKVTLVR